PLNIEILSRIQNSEFRIQNGEVSAHSEFCVLNPGFAFLLRIQFHDQLLIQLNLHEVFPFGEALDLALQSFTIYVDPVGSGRVRRGVAGGENRRVILARLPHRHNVADLDQSGGDVALAAVDFDVTMAHDLACLVAAGTEPDAINDAVQTALEVGHEVIAGDALLMRGLLEPAAELALQHAVDAANLLLFAKLQAVA